MSTMKISSVKLVNYGTKGIEVTYANPSKKNNRQFMDEYKVKRKAPIHEELESTFSWLKDHVLNICSYTNEEVDREYLKNNLEMISVKVDKGGFILVAELKILDGTKTLKLETPLVSTDVEYPEANDVVKIIQGIFSETIEYMEGKKSLSDAQIVMKFASKEDGFDPERVKTMSTKELKDWATEILENQGHIVIHSEEMEEDDSEQEDFKEIVPVKEKAPTKKIKAETSFETPKESKVKEVPSENNKLSEPIHQFDDDFSLSGGPSSPTNKSEDEDFSLGLDSPSNEDFSLGLTREQIETGDFSLGLESKENKSTAKRRTT